MDIDLQTYLCILTLFSPALLFFFGNIATNVWLLCPGPRGPSGALRVRCLGDVYVTRQGLEGDGHLCLVHGDRLMIP